MAKKELTFMYDRESDILYAFTDRSDMSIYDLAEGGVYLRKNPETGEIVGFMIHHFSKKFTGRKVSIPHFENLAIPPLAEITL